MTETGSLLRTLECRACCTEVDPDRPNGTCTTCGQTLLAGYDLDRLDGKRWWRSLSERPPSLWRYRELLPIRNTESVASLGEPITPIVPLGPVPAADGVELLLKDDGGLPTGSFKARGMAVAVSRASELKLKEIFVPSAGRAGLALAAYAARAGLTSRVYVPEGAPEAFVHGPMAFGAAVTRLGRTIREAGEAARSREQGRGSFDLSTLREPYRVEGKKTMGFEIVESLGADRVPDAIVYPTGGGTGLVGMYKAFRELQSVRILERIPRLIAVQPAGCAPVVRAILEGSPRATPWEDPESAAPGLVVPTPFSSERILEAVRESRGTGVVVSDDELKAARRDLALTHGIDVALEGAAPYAALPHLLRSRAIRDGEHVLLYNTGRTLGAPPSQSPAIGAIL